MRSPAVHQNNINLCTNMTVFVVFRRRKKSPSVFTAAVAAAKVIFGPLVSVLLLLLLLQSSTNGFVPAPLLWHPKRQNYKLRKLKNSSSSLYLAEKGLRKNIEIPLLVDLIDRKKNENTNSDDDASFVVPLPSYGFPDEVATPFLYGIKTDTPLRKLIMEEAISLATTSSEKPYYGHLIWKDKNSDSLVGAIGCTAEILANEATLDAFTAAGRAPPALSPMEEELDRLKKSYFASPSIEDEDDGVKGAKNIEDNADTIESLPLTNVPISNTILCRGGWRFIVKEVVRTIPYPVVIVDEFQDDDDDDDSDLFFNVSPAGTKSDEENETIAKMSVPELIQNTMCNVQSIIKLRLEDATAKSQLNPLEKSILEDVGMTSGDNHGKDNTSIINPAAIELAHAEEMSAVWSVFQMALVDDFLPSVRRFAVAIMAAELANLKDNIRKEILLVRNGKERLQIILKELNEIVGMHQARKLASSITDKNDESERDLKVGQPGLPPWAKQIRKGTKVEYYWNEEYGWCGAIVIQDPVTIVDELLITVQFEDGEVHKLPLGPEDKLRWRPGK